MQAIIDKYGIQDKIIFHGQLFGDALDKVFNQSCFAIGSLARHRSGITIIKTLKNREYATRGLDFIDHHQIKPEEIRKTVENLSWKIQMQKVIDEA